MMMVMPFCIYLATHKMLSVREWNERLLIDSSIFIHIELPFVAFDDQLLDCLAARVVYYIYAIAFGSQSDAVVRWFILRSFACALVVFSPHRLWYVNAFLLLFLLAHSRLSGFRLLLLLLLSFNKITARSLATMCQSENAIRVERGTEI